MPTNATNNGFQSVPKRKLSAAVDLPLLSEPGGRIALANASKCPFVRGERETGHQDAAEDLQEESWSWTDGLDGIGTRAVTAGSQAKIGGS